MKLLSFVNENLFNARLISFFVRLPLNRTFADSSNGSKDEKIKKACQDDVSGTATRSHHPDDRDRPDEYGSSNKADFNINEKDILENIIRGSGPGGQSVNTSSNCVQLKHMPTGIIVKCHKSRSLFQNRKLAREMLFEKLEFLFKGEESKIGKKLEKRKKRQTEQKRRQRLRARAKSEPLSFKMISSEFPDKN